MSTPELADVVEDLAIAVGRDKVLADDALWIECFMVAIEMVPALAFGC